MVGNVRTAKSKGTRSCAGMLYGNSLPAEQCPTKIKPGEFVLERYEIQFKVAFKSRVSYPTTVRRTYCTVCAKHIMADIQQELHIARSTLHG